MKEEPQKDISGVLFRGADGNLYFVPDSALESELAPFRVLESERGRIERYLAPEAPAAPPAFKAVRATIPYHKRAPEEVAPEAGVAMIIFIDYLENDE